MALDILILLHINNITSNEKKIITNTNNMSVIMLKFTSQKMQNYFCHFPTEIKSCMEVIKLQASLEN